MNFESSISRKNYVSSNQIEDLYLFFIEDLYLEITKSTNPASMQPLNEIDHDDEHLSTKHKHENLCHENIESLNEIDLDDEHLTTKHKH